MTIRRKFLAGGAVLSLGQVAGQGLSALRNILVARLILSEADFGIAAILTLIVGLNETLSNLGTNTLVIQDRDADDPQFLAGVHFIAFLRGVFGSMALLVLAYPLSILFGVSEATWAFAWLAIIPFARGLTHHDMWRMQRRFDFLPAVLQEFFCQLITLAICIPFLRIFQDYSSVLYLLIAQAVASAVLSHIIAKSPYRWSYDRKNARRIAAFGVPLMLSGIFQIAIYQGERISLGSASQLFSAAQYTMEDMGAYSAAFLIASLIPQFLLRVNVSLFTPLLSKQGDERFLQRNALCNQFSALISGALTIPLILFSDTIVNLAYRDRYASAGAIVACVACGQALGILRAGGSVSLMAKGYTWDAFIGIVWRSLSFPGIMMVAAAGLPIVWLAVPAIVAEIIATGITARQARTRNAIPVFDLLGPLLLLCLGLAFAYLTRLFWGGEPKTIGHVLTGIAIWLGFVAAGLSFFSVTTNSLLNFLRRPSHGPVQGSPVNL